MERQGAGQDCGVDLVVVAASARARAGDTFGYLSLHDTLDEKKGSFNSDSELTKGSKRTQTQRESVAADLTLSP